MPRVVLAVALVVSGCEPAAANATPAGAVRELHDRLARLGSDETSARAVYAVLSAKTRQNLDARAARYGDASGKMIDPVAMLVPARAHTRFVPHSYRAHIDGSRATVDILGVSEHERAQLQCVLEDGLWRVELPLPELVAMPRRPGAEP